MLGYERKRGREGRRNGEGAGGSATPGMARSGRGLDGRRTMQVGVAWEACSVHMPMTCSEESEGGKDGEVKGELKGDGGIEEERKDAGTDKHPFRQEQIRCTRI